MNTELRLMYLEALWDGLLDGRYPDSSVCQNAMRSVLQQASHRELDDSRYERYITLAVAC